jgi:3-polyprenyl-4-hydroxybenzoate decarboxylase
MEVAAKDFKTNRATKTGTSGTSFTVRFLDQLEPSRCSVSDVMYDEGKQIIGFALEGIYSLVSLKSSQSNFFIVSGTS